MDSRISKNDTNGNNYWRGNYNGQYKAQDPYYSYYSAYKQNEYDDLKTSSFYSERYQKPHKGKIKEIIVPLIIVALLSSVIGGALVGAWFQFGAPALAGDTGNKVIDNNSIDTQPVKQIEIVDRTDSPVTAIAEKVSPSIVGIQVNYRIQDFWFGTQMGSGSGSGIIIRSDGYILQTIMLLIARPEPEIQWRRSFNQRDSALPERPILRGENNRPG